MRIRISHDTIYRYASPPAGVIQILRMTPRNHDGQYVSSWRIDISADCRVDAQEDSFGNLTHTFSVDGPVSELNVHVEGEVDTDDTHGLVRGAIERFPATLFLRETPLTAPNPAMRDFAAAAKAAAEPDSLSILHSLLKAVHAEITFDVDPTHSATTAQESFAIKRGVCQDLTHIFIACARGIGIPARYVSGYFFRADGVVEQTAGHAWAEAFVDDLGWVGFDAANKISTTDAHLRVAIGLDYLSAAPIRGTRYGGGDEALTVRVHVDQAMRQVQG